MTERLTDEAAQALADRIAYVYCVGFPHAPRETLVWRAMQYGALLAIFEIEVRHAVAVRLKKAHRETCAEEALAALVARAALTDTGALLDTHVVTPETPDETTARMKADMDHRLDDPVVRASVCRLPKGYTLAERPTNTSERERVARAYVTHKGWDWYQAECDEDAGCCQCLSCYYQGSLTIPDVREAEMQAADAAIAAMDRPTTSASVVDAVDWATKMIEKTGVESAADYYWLDSRPGKPPHSAPPTQSQEVRMADPTIPGLDAAVTIGSRALFYSEYPRALWEDLDDLDRRAYREQVRAVLTAAYCHLIEPAIRAAREDVRERCAMAVPLRSDDGFEEPWDNGYNAAIEEATSLIRALPLTDPTESPEAV